MKFLGGDINELKLAFSDLQQWYNDILLSCKQLHWSSPPNPCSFFWGQWMWTLSQGKL